MEAGANEKQEIAKEVSEEELDRLIRNNVWASLPA